jgi:probable HAF family extracellular repeat protein
MNTARLRATALTLALSAISAVASAQTTAAYQGFDLGNLGGQFTYVTATALNDLGQVTGYGRLADGTTRAFVTGPGGQNMQLLGSLGTYTDIRPMAINNSGVLVGVASTASISPTPQEAFKYDPASGQVLSLGLGQDSTATAINQSGQIAGTYRDAQMPYGGFYLTGADGSINKNLSPTSGSGVHNVVGLTNDGRVAVNITPGGLAYLHGALLASDGKTLTSSRYYANGVNNLGQMAVTTTKTLISGSHNQYQTVVTDYDTLAINDAGMTVGRSGPSSVFESTPHTLDIKDAAGNIVFHPESLGYYTQPQGTGASNYVPDLNNLGDFVVNGSNGHAYLVSSVPELDTGSSMVLGLGALGWAVTRRRARPAA